jgi:hypothetical protein
MRERHAVEKVSIGGASWFELQKLGELVPALLIEKGAGCCVDV